MENFQNGLKPAEVTPIFLKECTPSAKNYRVVSVLPSLSQVS